MRNISVWAYRNKWTARFIIVVSFFILNCLGLFLGDVLIASGTLIPSIWIYLISFIFIAGFISYPLRKEKKAYQNFYNRQKTSDLLLVSTTFLLIICFGNHYSLAKNQSPFAFTYVNATELTRANATTIHETSIEPSPKKKTSLIKKWKQKIRENIRTIRKE